MSPSFVKAGSILCFLLIAAALYEYFFDHHFSQIEIFRQLSDTTLRFNQIHHFSEHPFRIDHAERRVIQDPGYDYRNVVEYHLKSATIQFEEGTNHIIKFKNSDALNASGDIKSQSKIPQSWPESKAVAIARDWLKLFNISDEGLLFDGGKARFVYQFGTEGTWIVSFTRVSKKGFPFGADYRDVNISESQGPFYMAASPISDFEETTFNPISQAAALEKAEEGLKEIQKSNIGKGWLGSRSRSEDTPIVQLLIVNPNNLTKQKNIETAAAADQQKARLAWVVRYKMRDPNPVPQPDGTSVYHDDAHVVVYIDAENGALLGGSL